MLDDPCYNATYLLDTTLEITGDLRFFFLLRGAVQPSLICSRVWRQRESLA